MISIRISYNIICTCTLFHNYSRLCMHCFAYDYVLFFTCMSSLHKSSRNFSLQASVGEARNNPLTLHRVMYGSLIINIIIVA